MTEPTTGTARPAGYAGTAGTTGDYRTSRPATMSGISDDEARGFNKMFITSFIGFTLVAAVAHYAVWQWRPWIPGVAGYDVPVATAPATTR